MEGKGRGGGEGVPEKKKENIFVRISRKIGESIT